MALGGGVVLQRLLGVSTSLEAAIGIQCKTFERNLYFPLSHRQGSIYFTCTFLPYRSKWPGRRSSVDTLSISWALLLLPQPSKSDCWTIWSTNRVFCSPLCMQPPLQPFELVGKRTSVSDRIKSPFPYPVSVAEQCCQLKPLQWFPGKWKNLV